MERDVLWGGLESRTEDVGMGMRNARGNVWDGATSHPRRERERP